MRLDQQNDDIGIGRATPSGGDHGAVQPAAGLKQAGRVDKDDLRVALDGDTADPRARRLYFMGHDRDLGPHHPVEQGGFARIGLSDQGNETGTGGHGICPWDLWPVVLAHRGRICHSPQLRETGLWLYARGTEAIMRRRRG